MINFIGRRYISILIVIALLIAVVVIKQSLRSIIPVTIYPPKTSMPGSTSVVQTTITDNSVQLREKALIFLKANQNIYSKVYTITPEAMQLYINIPKGYVLDYDWYKENSSTQEHAVSGDFVVSWVGLPGCEDFVDKPTLYCSSKLKIDVYFDSSRNAYKIAIHDVGGVVGESGSSNTVSISPEQPNQSETTPETVCQSNSDCRCRIFTNGGEFLPGTVEGYCYPQTNRCELCVHK